MREISPEVISPEVICMIAGNIFAAYGYKFERIAEDLLTGKVVLTLGTQGRKVSV